ncbi:MAG: SGNH/GDSL hydrolase family protein [bacterium]
MRYASVVLLFALSLHGLAQQTVTPRIDSSLAWYTVSQWGVEGKGWSDVNRHFDRLPAKAESLVRKEIWDLSRSSAGMSCRFRTDAEEIHVRYKLYSKRIAMAHMPATGVSGVDLYGQLKSGEWQWVATSRPSSEIVRELLVKELLPGKRAYILYLPLYNGIDSLEIGVPIASLFDPIASRTEKPIVFYGTSIMQGACASRAGMAMTAILERRLKRPIINLGFSGNGKMEIEVGKLMNELDPLVYVIDCLPNLKPEEVAARTEPFVRLLREQHPTTPILLVEDRIMPNAPLLPQRQKTHHDRQAALKAAYTSLKKQGVKGLYYLEGRGLLGNDGEATVDGSHPTDLGMMRYADQYEVILKKILRDLSLQKRAR